jgi:small subunit ribosomal protein S15
MISFINRRFRRFNPALSFTTIAASKPTEASQTVNNCIINIFTGKPIPQVGAMKKFFELEKAQVSDLFAYGLTEQDIPPEAQHSETFKKMLSIEYAPNQTKYQTLKHRMMQYYARRLNDTGSPEVQIAAITVHIEQLNEHCQSNKHDYKASRKAVMLVHQRKRHLKYLRKIDLSRYYTMVEELGLSRDYLDKFENKYFFHGQKHKIKTHRTVRGGGNRLDLEQVRKILDAKQS